MTEGTKATETSAPLRTTSARWLRNRNYPSGMKLIDPSWSELSVDKLQRLHLSVSGAYKTLDGLLRLLNGYAVILAEDVAEDLQRLRAQLKAADHAAAEIMAEVKTGKDIVGNLRIQVKRKTVILECQANEPQAATAGTQTNAVTEPTKGALPTKA